MTRGLFFRVHKVAHSCYLGLWLILVAVRLILQRVDNFTFNQSADFTRTLKVAELKVIHKTAFSLFEPRLGGNDWSCTPPPPNTHLTTTLHAVNCGPSLTFSLSRPEAADENIKRHMCTVLATAGSVMTVAVSCTHISMLWIYTMLGQAVLYAVKWSHSFVV